jgi:hypothetical protein
MIMRTNCGHLTLRTKTRENFIAGILTVVLFGNLIPVKADQPVLSLSLGQTTLPVAQISVTNTADGNSVYVVQSSMDLSNWTSIYTNFLSPTGFTAGFSATNGTEYYRVMEISNAFVGLYWNAITVATHLAISGDNCRIDSFDSSKPLYSTGGQYDVTKAQAKATIATASVTNGDLDIGNANVYGRVLTGPGTVQTNVLIVSNGAVGDTNWNATSAGIQPGAWSGDFNVMLPDLGPVYGGGLPWLTSLPAPVGGTVYLNTANYMISPSDPYITNQLCITGFASIWVQGSYSMPSIVMSNFLANLFISVGTSTGSGDSLTIGAQGPINTPGRAGWMGIFGLPSLTSITITNSGTGSAGTNGSVTFVGTIYAPEADVSGGGNSTNTLETAGAMTVRSLDMRGHWNFHFDQVLSRGAL